MIIVIDILKKVNSKRDRLFSYPPNIEPYLYLTDNEMEAKELSFQGHYVIPIIKENSKCDYFWNFKYVITNPNDIDDEYLVRAWQRLSNQPWHILYTNRCLIREMTEFDLHELYNLYKDEDILRFTEALFPDYEDELEYTKNYINNVYSYFGFGTWIIEEISSRKIIGRAGFNYRPGFDSPELGFVIGKEYRNIGYAFEVCNSIIDYGFNELGFESIQALTMPENYKCIKLLNKLGFFNTGNYSEYIIYKKQHP